VTAVTALFFGDRIGRLRDPLGNVWWIQAHVEDVDPAELARRPHDPGAAEALRYVESSLDAAMRERGSAVTGAGRGRSRCPGRGGWR
jgi:PhnB protein